MNKKIAFAALFSLFLPLTFALYVFFSPYPELKEFQNRPISTRIYDSDEKIIQITAVENGIRREFLPIDEIPEKVKFFFIQSEDKNFYHHFGIDFSAIIRAFFQNASEFRTVSGASTVTMQLSRIIKPNKNRNLISKIKEATDALRLENRLSKSEILELYLNAVPFGFNTEGVASAAKTFFAKNLAELTEAEIACLSVIPRRPSLYNPLKNPKNCAEAAFELHSSVKSQSGKESLQNLTLEDFEKAAKKAKSYSYGYDFPHFVRHILTSDEISSQRLPEIHTTLNTHLQHIAEDILSSEIEKYSQNRLSNGAIVIFETKSGAILSWVGSSDFFDEAHNGQIDGVLSLQQAGSSMKPFLYAIALENGFSPSSVLPDIPMEFGFENLYAPQNFNNRFNGPVRFRVALASSLNIPAVYLLNEIGLETYLKKLGELDFLSLKDSSPGLSLALGSEPVSLLELTRAFSVFARDGRFLALHYLKNGEATNEKQIYEVNAARMISDILSDKDSRSLGFGYNQQFSTDFPSIFKTGTANQYQSITALGATPDFSVGVWLGNFSGETIVGKTGSSIPAKIAKELLDILQGNKKSEFKKPSQIKKEKICTVSGLLASEYCPHTLNEYVTSESKACDWHTAEGIVYPNEYSTWFRLKNRNGDTAPSGGKLQIISPRNGSVFYYDASIQAGQQKLIVEAIGGSENTARYFYDGKMISETARPFLLQIDLERGNHAIKVRCGDESEEIGILVK